MRNAVIIAIFGHHLNSQLVLFSFFAVWLLLRKKSIFICLLWEMGLFILFIYDSYSGPFLHKADNLSQVTVSNFNQL